MRLPVFAQEVTRYSKGVWSSRLRLYPEGFFEVFFPVPPLSEQRAIVAHIAAETAKLDALRAATERTIALLKERRAALIAAAVTGQLDREAGMIVTRLKLTNLRAVDGRPSSRSSRAINLIVGVNGVGKTTVLDALRICFSKMLPAVTASRSRPIPFNAEDIRGKAAAMTVRLFSNWKRETSSSRPQAT